jgi:very-short-patch-repair endonuclease
MPKKGGRLSEECRRKLLVALVGKKLSEEHKQKLSVAHMGKKASEEAKRKMSVAQRNRKRGPCSEETKRKISRTSAGRKLTEEAVRKLVAANTGQRRSEEAKHRMSLAQMGHKTTEEAKHNMSLAHAGQGQGRHLSEDTRQKLSVVVKKQWAGLTLEERSRRIAVPQRAAQKANPSSIERAICQVLDALDIEYETQVLIGPYLADILIRSQNLILECDGSYWHSRPGVAEKDRKRDTYLKGLGYRVVRLGEKEIRKNPKLALLERAGIT